MSKIRVKTSKAAGDSFPILVERANPNHHHEAEKETDRKYAVYEKKMDWVIEEGILDGVPFQQIKKKLFKTFSSAEDFKSAKGMRRLYQKFHR